MWGTVVATDGTVCAVAYTGAKVGDQWLGSRVISAPKANTANAFSLPGLALSTANLYSATQPGGSLFGLQFSNPVDTQVLKPFPAAYRTLTDGLGIENGGPTRTRTWNQRIHAARCFRTGVDYLITLSLRWWGAGGSGLLSRALQPPGSLCTFRRCTAGLAQDCPRPNR